MLSYVIRRVIGVVPTLLVLIACVVGLLRVVPGNPVDVMLSESLATPQQRVELEDHLGLNRSFPEQLWSYLRDVANGSFGHSLWTGKSVSALMADRMLPTFELATLALIIGIAIGLPAGILGAVRQNTAADLGARSLILLFLSVPQFVLATAVVVLPSIYFQWTPPLRYVAFSDNIAGNLKYFLMPSLILGIGLSASVARFTRTSMLDVVRADYIRTARSKGLGPGVVLYRHSLRNALIPVVTLIGVQVGTLLGGSVVIEQIFGIPGMGRLLLDGLSRRDYPVVQGIILMLGLIVVTMNLVVDIVYVALDPRIRYA